VEINIKNNPNVKTPRPAKRSGAGKTTVQNLKLFSFNI